MIQIGTDIFKKLMSKFRGVELLIARKRRVNKDLTTLFQ